MRKLLKTAAVSALFVLAAGGIAVAGNAVCYGSGCDEQSRQALRDTRSGMIKSFANHCDATLRKFGEAVAFQVTPMGHKAYSSAARALPGLSWAAYSNAGNDFVELGLRDSQGNQVVNTELCADSSVWANALAALGVTPRDILDGRVQVWLCGDTKSHAIPAYRFTFLEGTLTSGQYSVLTAKDTDRIVRELTAAGY